MNEPPRKSLWTKVSRALGGPRSLRTHEAVILVVAGLGLITALGIKFIPELTTNSADPGPGWAQPETLPNVKPVWTDKLDALSHAAIHDDVLAVFDTPGSDGSPTIYDLATGETLMHNEKGGRSWLSGDNLIVSARSGIDVFDIHTGEKSHTIELGIAANATVASGMLVTVDLNSDRETHMRGIDVTTGKTKWTKLLSGLWSDYELGAPGPLGIDGLFGSNFHHESTSPITLVKDQKQNGRIDAIDVKTGKKRWSDNDAKLTDTHIRLTEDNNLYSRGEDGTSHIIDSQTGETTEYPKPPEDMMLERETPLDGNHLLTTDSGHPAVTDITTGKIVWRATDSDAFGFDGGIVFENVTFDPEDPSEYEIQGTRAIDVESKKTLWTREEFGNVEIAVAGDAVVRNEIKYVQGRKVSTQIFDRETGEGRFQLRFSNQLLTHNDDYLVFTISNPGHHRKLAVVPRDG